jgi:hypothetical protein
MFHTIDLRPRLQFGAPVPFAFYMYFFSRRSVLPLSCRKTMALKLTADCGQTRGQYPAPPP